MQSKTPRLSTFIALNIFLISAYANAEEPPPPLEISKIPEVTQAPENSVDDSLSLSEILNLEVNTASRRTEKLSQAPANMVVVTKQQILERRYVSLIDLLEDLPSIDVFRHVAEGWGSTVSIRGNEGPNKFVVLKDGIRLSPITGDAAPMEENYPLFNAKQVEIVFGPASAVYGADAFTGIINIVTEETKDGIKGSVSGAGGSNYYNYEYVTFGHKVSDTVTYDIAFQRSHSNGPDLPSAYPDQYNMTYKDIQGDGTDLVYNVNDPYILINNNWNLEAKVKLDQKFQVGTIIRDIYQPSAMADFPQYVVYKNQPAIHYQFKDIFAKYKTDMASWASSESIIQYQTVSELPDSDYQNSFDNQMQTWKYSNSQILRAIENLSFNLSETQNLMAGFQFDSVHAMPESGDLPKPFDPNLPSPLQNTNYIFNSNVPEIAFELSYQTFGGYLQLHSEWTPWLTTTIGARYDNDSRYGGVINPRAGAVFKISDHSAFKLLYGESFRAPSAYEQYQVYGSFDATTQIANFFQIPNSGLKPEKGRTLEANYSTFILSNLFLNASAYYTQLTNLIYLYSGTNQIQFLGQPVSSWYQYQNTGTEYLYGGDVTLNYETDVDKVRLKPWVSYSYSNGRVNELGAEWDKVNYNSNHKGKGGITVKYGMFSLTPRFRVWGPIDYRQPGGTTMSIPGAMTWDATLLASDVLPGLNLTFDVHNLFDRRFFRAGGYDYLAFSALPQDPRSIYFQATYKF